MFRTDEAVCTNNIFCTDFAIYFQFKESISKISYTFSVSECKWMRNGKEEAREEVSIQTYINLIEQQPFQQVLRRNQRLLVYFSDKVCIKRESCSVNILTSFIRKPKVCEKKLQFSNENQHHFTRGKSIHQLLLFCLHFYALKIRFSAMFILTLMTVIRFLFIPPLMMVCDNKLQCK